MGKEELASFRFAQHYPDLGDGPVPVEPYISADYFEREREAVFKRHWLNVGRADAIPNAGDFFVKDLAVLGASVLVIRGDDGQVRAFHNVCQHRGNLIAYEERGCRKVLTCSFHGWVYDSRGRLVDVPDQAEFYRLDRAALGLREFACDTWNGFVFIHPQDNPPQDLPTYLGALGANLKDYPFDQMELVGSWRATVASNWKAFIDAFQEGYHVAMVHRRSLPDAFSGGAIASCLLEHARIDGPHRALSCPANPSRNPKPAEALAFKAAATLTQGAAAMQNLMPGLNPGGMANWGFDVNVFFPNFFIDPANGWYFTYNFWPEAVNRTHWEVRMYMLKAPNAAVKVASEFSKVLLRDAVLEDLSTLEATQRGLESGGIRTLQFSDQEIACRHQYVVVDRLVRAG